MWITSVLFSSWSAAFEKSFDEWTMILLSPLLISFAQTKALALPPIPWTTPFPWLVAKYFHKKAVLCFLLSDWRNFTMSLFLSSDDGLCDHLICTAPGSSKWLMVEKMMLYHQLMIIILSGLITHINRSEMVYVFISRRSWN